MSIFQRKKMDFTTGPIFSSIILFAIPIVLNSVMHQFFNTADTIMVGRWGGADAEARETALAAVGSCSALVSLLVNFFSGVANGGTITLSHAVGAKDKEECDKVVHTALLTATICGLAAMTVGLIAARPLLVMMGTHEEVMGQAVGYMRAYFLGTPAHLLFSAASGLLRADGDSSSSVIMLFFSGITNIVLNFIMICVFAMGAVGVGIATAASHWLSCFLIIRYLHKHEGNSHFEFRRLRICKPQLKKILAIGVPAGIQSSMFSISNVIIQSSINSFDKAVVAGNTAAASVQHYCSIFFGGFGSAASSFVGQNMGAKQYKRMKKGVLTCATSVTVLALSISVIVTVFGKTFLGIYTPGNDAAIAAGMIRLQYVILPYFVSGLSEVASAWLRGIGKSVQAMTVNLLGVGGFRVLWVLAVFPHFRTLGALYLCWPISWVFAAVAMFALSYIATQKLERKQAEAAQKTGAESV
jgi:putative MATE family efflux protein